MHNYALPLLLLDGMLFMLAQFPTALAYKAKYVRSPIAELDCKGPAECFLPVPTVEGKLFTGAPNGSFLTSIITWKDSAGNSHNFKPEVIEVHHFIANENRHLFYFVPKAESTGHYYDKLEFTDQEDIQYGRNVGISVKHNGDYHIQAYLEWGT